jgi:hypothetical protein
LDLATGMSCNEPVDASPDTNLTNARDFRR